MRPEIGSTGQSTPRTRMNSSPHRKSGIASASATKPSTAIPASGGGSRRREAQGRRREGRRRDWRSAPVPAWPAGGRGRATSPLAAADRGAEIAARHLRSQTTNWSRSADPGRSAPQPVDIRRLAPGGSIIAIGSPGTTRTSTKTTTATPNSVGGTRSRRRRIAPRPIPAPPRRRLRPAPVLADRRRRSPGLGSRASGAAAPAQTMSKSPVDRDPGAPFLKSAIFSAPCPLLPSGSNQSDLSAWS